MLSPWLPPWREPPDEPEPAAEESLGETEHLKGSARAAAMGCGQDETLGVAAGLGGTAWNSSALLVSALGNFTHGMKALLLGNL